MRLGDCVTEGEVTELLLSYQSLRSFPLDSFLDRFGFSSIQGTCTEQALCFIGNKLGLEKIVDFDMKKYAARVDYSMDLFGLAASNGTLDLARFVNIVNGSQRDLRTSFSSLDRAHCYLTWNGSAGGTGHYSVLFYERNGWHWFDRSGFRIERLTLPSGGVLLNSGLLNVPEDRWGGYVNGYNIVAYPMDRSVLLSLVDFVKHYRMQQASRQE